MTEQKPEPQEHGVDCAYWVEDVRWLIAKLREHSNDTERKRAAMLALQPDLTLSVNHGDYEHGYSQGVADAAALLEENPNA